MPVRLMVRRYRRHWPHHTVASLRTAIRAIRREERRIDHMTIAWFMMPKRHGGRGYGRLLKRKWYSQKSARRRLIW